MGKLLALFPAAAAAAPAAAIESAAESAPVESASPVVTVLFLLVFLGCLGVYLWMTMRNEKSGNKEADPDS